ncbi:hypothetical protein EJ05DRAFT_505337 [Pseudovirgaria hyperparasitica]|uniref:Uncharacterized protein n=1 Tax=Pseudovirgaria hyperparasitica TaxID=470096 RepID=A0A6A6VTM5_9PEZI|nr:uncharacterized protein EJ05DRAFT_505337 [Pseudovirgaria hyperparasitica]KAF2753146.1 hypothetical protein EJ05DRAFT_505337 [Pseudovirgaria hyperparasitica]
MFLRNFFMTLAFAASTVARNWPFPESTGEFICDSTLHPDWSECENIIEPMTYEGSYVGPRFAEGQAFTGKACQIRTLRCDSEDGEYREENVSSMYGIVRNECMEHNSAGAYRSGDTCVLVDNPENPFGSISQEK